MSGAGRERDSTAEPGAFDWQARYASGDTPWDLGAPHPELLARLEAGAFDELRKLRDPVRAFVPGCGRGHDAWALARAGFEVTAVDCVAVLAQTLAPRLAPFGGRFVAGDALERSATGCCELFFEHTFYSAIAPRRRRDWGALAARALVPGGWLAALVFPFDRPPELAGPPWTTRTEDMARALGDEFELCEDVPVARAGAGRRWAERWAVFRKVAGN